VVSEVATTADRRADIDTNVFGKSRDAIALWLGESSEERNLLENRRLDAHLIIVSCPGGRPTDSAPDRYIRERLFSVAHGASSRTNIAYHLFTDGVIRKTMVLRSLP